MPHQFGHQAGGTDLDFGAEERKKKFELGEAKARCTAQGGNYDEKTGECIFPVGQGPQPIVPKEPIDLTGKDKEEPTEVIPKNPEFIKDEQGNITGLIRPDGTSNLDLSQEDVDAILNNFNQIPQQVQQQGIQEIGTAQRGFERQQQAQQLGGTVGQFNELGVSPTGLDKGEAAIAGITSGIPRTLGILGAAAVGGGFIGAKAGGAAGTAVAPGIGTAIGASVGLVAGISASIITNLKSQRRDTTTAQQRVLDEGKQNLNDWATLAAADPANRPTYVKNFNEQLALIDQAYRQMKLDTSRDVAKFETALPNLAEFETFYSTAGERDNLQGRMFEALAVPQDPEFIYRAAELAERRK